MAFFSSHGSISERRKLHALSESICVNKGSETFLGEWVKIICGFIRAEYQKFPHLGNWVVSVGPHRPGQTPRLENLLNQLKTQVLENPFRGSARILFEPKLLAYKKGLRSNHTYRLTAEERFENVREHLYTLKPEAAQRGEMVVVIVDVCTTGASLIYARKFFEDEGASEVRRLAISINIGRVFYD